MIEFESFCYLQNHKTGCSFVESFLRRFCDEAMVRYEKHASLAAPRPGKFHFVNVREPLDLYLSLFNYGLDGKGALLESLKKRGQGALYEDGIEGFGRWLDFMLDPANTEVVYPPAARALAPHAGLLTWRYLRLACPGLVGQAHRLDTPAALRDFHDAHMAMDAVLRHETLRRDLAAVVAGPLRDAFVDVDAALAWIRESEPVNASTRRDRRTEPVLPGPLLRRLREREAFLHERFYPDGPDTFQNRGPAE